GGDESRTRRPTCRRPGGRGRRGGGACTTWRRAPPRRWRQATGANARARSAEWWARGRPQVSDGRHGPRVGGRGRRGRGRRRGARGRESWHLVAVARRAGGV